VQAACGANACAPPTPRISSRCLAFAKSIAAFDEDGTIYAFSVGREESIMRAAAAASLTREPAPDNRETRVTTLLALVRAVSDVTRDDREVVATILSMLRSGEVRLCGNFRNAPIEDFE
jgi:hypothetical protein